MSRSDYQLVVDGAWKIFEIARNMRILSHLAWPLSLREDFFRSNKARLPTPEYPDFDSTDIIATTSKITKTLGDSPVEQWLARQAGSVENAARMLSAAGTPEFYHYSNLLYGGPRDPVTDERNNVIHLAHKFDASLKYFKMAITGDGNQELFDAEAAARKIGAITRKMFGDDSPEILIVQALSANATASATRIRLRQDAMFSRRYIDQLIAHEASIHYATAHNGRIQRELPIMALSHPGTTRTQEGMAVFAEFITGTIDLDRVRKLSDRVIAIDMAIQGADFMEVFRYFNQHGDNEVNAYENTRRVFRGGVISGGAPFTKDIVYLDGLLRVHNFLRAIVAKQRIDVMPYLFAGKLDLEDLPALCELAGVGILKPPVYLPGWIEDPQFLLSYLAYSSFLNQIDMNSVETHYEKLLAQVHFPEKSGPG